MNRLVRVLVIVPLIPVLLFVAFWFNRTRTTAVKAAQYAPAAPQLTVIPPGTQFQAILRDGIPESTKAGDKIVGFISPPVVVKNKVAIPAGTPLKGVVEEAKMGEKKGIVRGNFV